MATLELDKRLITKAQYMIALELANGPIRAANGTPIIGTVSILLEIPFDYVQAAVNQLEEDERILVTRSAQFVTMRLNSKTARLYSKGTPVWDGPPFDPRDSRMKQLEAPHASDIRVVTYVGHTQRTPPRLPPSTSTAPAPARPTQPSLPPIPAKSTPLPKKVRSTSPSPRSQNALKKYSIRTRDLLSLLVRSRDGQVIGEQAQGPWLNRQLSMPFPVDTSINRFILCLIDEELITQTMLNLRRRSSLAITQAGRKRLATLLTEYPY